MRRASSLPVLSAIFMLFLIFFAVGSFAESAQSTNFLVDYDLTHFSQVVEGSSASFNLSSAGSVIGDSASSSSFNVFYGILAGATEYVTTSTTTTTAAVGTSGLLSYSTSSDNKVSGISVDPGANVTVKAFTNISLTAINIIANRTISNAGIVAKKVEESALTVSKPAEKSYQFIQIDKTNIADVALRTVKIKFNVAKLWLTENNVAETQIALQRYDNERWTKLPTKKLSDDGTNINFESDSPGLSIFAITALAAGETPPSTIPEATEATSTTSPSGTSETTSTTAPTKTPTDSTGLIVVALLILVVVAAVFMRKK